jgi:hypothetical protein
MEIVERLGTKPPRFFRRLQVIATIIGGLAGLVVAFPIPALWIPYCTAVATAMGGVVFASQLVVNPKKAFELFVKYGLDKKLGQSGTLFVQDFIDRVQNDWADKLTGKEEFVLSFQEAIQQYTEIINQGGYFFLEEESGLWNWKFFDKDNVTVDEQKALYYGIRTAKIKYAS